MLPQRYQDRWNGRVVALALDRMSAGDTVLDVGGSDRPTIKPDQRPAGITYVGLDIDEALADGAYDECVIDSIEKRNPRLTGRFDVVVSWNTFEHVRDLSAAFTNIYEYLRPGGTLVTLFTGRWAMFAIAARWLPYSVRLRVMQRYLGASPEHHFPVQYDRCSYRQLVRILSTWFEPVVIPLYNGAGYFGFSSVLQRMYLAYENRSIGHPNLATHYLVVARRWPTHPVRR